MRRIVLMFVANFFRLPYMLFMIFHTNRCRKKYDRATRYAYLHRFVRWANWGGRVKVHADGMENIPADSGFIMYPNHQGMYDTLTMLEAVDRPFSPVVKIELKKVGLLHTVIDMLDGKYMDRRDLRQSMGIITDMAKQAAAGDAFVIYPEGTRSRQGNNMLAFKAGAFKAAVRARCPIVPVALIDCFIPFDQPSIRKIDVQAHILPAIYYEEYKDMTTHEIAAMVQERIRLKITEVTGVEAQVVEKLKSESEAQSMQNSHEASDSQSSRDTHEVQ